MQVRDRVTISAAISLLDGLVSSWRYSHVQAVMEQLPQLALHSTLICGIYFYHGRTAAETMAGVCTQVAIQTNLLWL